MAHGRSPVGHTFDDVEGQVTSLSICITKMGQTFIKCFEEVHIHDIYYTVKFHNQI